MSKRSSFEKSPRDYYRTFDKRAGFTLNDHLPEGTRFAEPFAGAGDLIHQLQDLGHVCMYKSDMEPQMDLSWGVSIERKDFREVTEYDLRYCDVMITNPPFTKELFHAAIEHFTPLIPCWWLMSSDWCFNVGSSKIIDKYVTDIVAIGRMQWIKGTNMSAKDNCIWLKTSRHKNSDTKFYNWRDRTIFNFGDN